MSHRVQVGQENGQIALQADRWPYEVLMLQKILTCFAD